MYRGRRVSFEPYSYSDVILTRDLDEGDLRAGDIGTLWSATLRQAWQKRPTQSNSST